MGVDRSNDKAFAQDHRTDLVLSKIGATAFDLSVDQGRSPCTPARVLVKGLGISLGCRIKGIPIFEQKEYVYAGFSEGI